MSEVVNEKSSAFLTVTLFDKDEQPAQPTSATYTIHDLDSGDEVRAVGALTFVAGVVEITLNKADNTFKDPDKEKETRQVTINAIYGAADELHDEFLYELVGIPKIL